MDNFKARVLPDGGATKRGPVRQDPVFQKAAMLLKALQPVLLSCNELFFLGKARCFPQSALLSGAKNNVNYQIIFCQAIEILILISRQNSFAQTQGARPKIFIKMILQAKHVQQDSTFVSRPHHWMLSIAFSISFLQNQARLCF